MSLPYYATRLGTWAMLETGARALPLTVGVFSRRTGFEDQLATNCLVCRSVNRQNSPPSEKTRARCVAACANWRFPWHAPGYQTARGAGTSPEHQPRSHVRGVSSPHAQPTHVLRSHARRGACSVRLFAPRAPTAARQPIPVARVPTVLYTSYSTRSSTLVPGTVRYRWSRLIYT